ncbi:unnamed protein product [Microthlaspi erraticum]|uniref:Uncharacterized protein n=1 Tax=Microthlaspi erraticum TaxID=1685480 RepID=A0A6D2JS59_9BRAS|nr:unnamed protein product [Microthlaspi erraticum]
MFRARPNSSVRLKSRPKSKPLGRSRIDDAVGHAQPRTTKAREPGSKPRGRATPSVPRTNAPSDPGKNARVRPRDFIGQIYPLDHADRP